MRSPPSLAIPVEEAPLFQNRLTADLAAVPDDWAPDFVINDAQTRATLYDTLAAQSGDPQGAQAGRAVVPRTSSRGSNTSWRASDLPSMRSISRWPTR